MPRKRRFSEEPNTYWTDQLKNPDNVAGYHPLGEEIWKQTNGEVDAFVQAVGTAASLRGTATVLKKHKANLKVVAVEPGESSVLLGGQPGSHNIEGVGIGYTPPLWDASLVDEIVPVKTDDAKEMLAALDKGQSLPPSHRATVAVWQLGSDLTTVMLPEEVVVDYVPRIQEAIGPLRLWIAGYCNEVAGYVPSRRVLREGGYETRGLYIGSGWFKGDVEDVLVKAVKELAVEVGRPESKNQS